MRRARIKEEGPGFYHCFSRIVDRQMLMNHQEKAIFHKLMRNMEGFSGVDVLTFALLDNHWHMLLYVPEAREIDDAEFVRRLGFLYRRRMVDKAEKHLAKLREQGRDEDAEAFKSKYTYRMHDLSEFMKTVQQCYSQGYNARHGRTGTLWEGRYNSILIEPDASNWSRTSGGEVSAMATVAAYIDLNSVRAGIVDDPKDYRWCGYGGAAGGKQCAREGIGRIMQSLNVEGDWDDIAEQYRQFLYLNGEERGVDENGRPLKRGFSREEIEAVIKAGGKLSFGQALRCRVRYFTEGVVLGTRKYVNDAFRRHRDYFGPRRDREAHAMAGADWCGLHSARSPRLRPVIAAPDTG